MEAILTSTAWKPAKHSGKGGPSGDEFANAQIDAYLQGRRDEADQVRKIVLAQIKQNTAEAAKLSTRILEHLEKKGVKAGLTRLRIVSLDHLEVLIEIPEKEFISKKFFSTYDLANKLENESRTELFSVSFSFLGVAGKVDEAHMRSDGFTFTLKS
ncbi:MAG: hypothetical protein M3R08_10340 [Bacteroidota bacterium]|nr:hypothetical protein [Bacteroidota bacterium]